MTKLPFMFNPHTHQFLHLQPRKNIDNVQRRKNIVFVVVKNKLWHIVW